MLIFNDQAFQIETMLIQPYIPEICRDKFLDIKYFITQTKISLTKINKITLDILNFSQFFVIGDIDNNNNARKTRKNYNLVLKTYIEMIKII